MVPDVSPTLFKVLCLALQTVTIEMFGSAGSVGATKLDVSASAAQLHSAKV